MLLCFVEVTFCLKRDSEVGDSGGEEGGGRAATQSAVVAALEQRGGVSPHPPLACSALQHCTTLQHCTPATAMHWFPLSPACWAGIYRDADTAGPPLHCTPLLGNLTDTLSTAGVASDTTELSPLPTWTGASSQGCKIAISNLF